MGAPEELRETTELFQFLELLASSETMNEILRAFRTYLTAWYRERIKDLQKVDGGWAPFDRDQSPLEISSVASLRRFQDVIYRQCIALKEAGIRPTPEIVELNEFLFIAVQLTESMKSQASRARSTASGTRSRLLKLL